MRDRLPPEPRRWPGPLLGLLVGVALGIAADRLVLRPGVAPAAAEDAAAEPAEAVEAAPPPPVDDPEPARAAVLEGLKTAGIPDRVIPHGLYPLTGPGRAPDDTLPLVGFTCPVGRDCPPVLVTIDEHVSAAGYTLIAPAGGDQPGRPLFRALARDGRPALALRAFPAGPHLTVVIEQVGREPALLDALLALDPHVTYAVVPNVRDASRVARRLVDGGREVIADLPLEPTDPTAQDGPDYLTAAMAPEAVTAAVDALLAQVPGAVGAGTHQGTRFASAREPLGALLGAIRQRGLYFLDDVDSPTSLIEPTARVAGVRTARFTHRIDDEGEALAARLRAIEAALVLDGHALVVVAPRPGALIGLRSWLDGLERRGIHLLRLSEVVR
ncbi:MAG: divergent polysaccharide deacetylase family protein [bacterium]